MRIDEKIGEAIVGLILLAFFGTIFFIYIGIIIDVAKVVLGGI